MSDDEIRREYLGQFDIAPAFLAALVERRLTNWEPWEIMKTSDALVRISGMSRRYSKTYLPFARRHDNDDVACITESGEVTILHDFASEGWHERETYPTLREWLDAVVTSIIEFESLWPDTLSRTRGSSAGSTKD